MESRRLFGLVSVLDRGEVVDVAAVGLDRREVKFNWKKSDHGRLQSVFTRVDSTTKGCCTSAQTSHDENNPIRRG